MTRPLPQVVLTKSFDYDRKTFPRSRAGIDRFSRGGEAFAREAFGRMGANHGLRARRRVARVRSSQNWSATNLYGVEPRRLGLFSGRRLEWIASYAAHHRHETFSYSRAPSLHFLTGICGATRRRVDELLNLCRSLVGRSDEDRAAMKTRAAGSWRARAGRR